MVFKHNERNLKFKYKDITRCIRSALFCFPALGGVLVNYLRGNLCGGEIVSINRFARKTCEDFL